MFMGEGVVDANDRARAHRICGTNQAKESIKDQTEAFAGAAWSDVSASFVPECFFPEHCPRPSEEDQKEEIGNAKWFPHARESGSKPVEQDHTTV